LINNSLAVGITVDGKNPKVVTKEVTDGVHKI
jgi:hypothetical protein